MCEEKIHLIIHISIVTFKFYNTVPHCSKKLLFTGIKYIISARLHYKTLRAADGKIMKVDI